MTKKLLPSGPIYQLRLALDGSRPPIWRRLEVRDGHLERLGEIIRAVMGWRSAEYWLFDVRGQVYGPLREEPDPDDDITVEDPTRFKLSGVLRQGIKKFHYIQDQAAMWDHVIEIEATLDLDPTATYPRCLDGRMANPPAAAGGLVDYYRLLDAMRDPHHIDDEATAALGAGFDPAAFDPAEVNARLAALG